MENEMHMRLTYREVKASDLEGCQHCLFRVPYVFGAVFKQEPKNGQSFIDHPVPMLYTGFRRILWFKAYAQSPTLDPKHSQPYTNPEPYFLIIIESTCPPPTP